MKGLTILGSTGSIGTQTLDIIKAFPHLYKVHALSCHSDLKTLEVQVATFSPCKVVVTNPAVFKEAKAMINAYPMTQLLCGKEALNEIVTDEQCHSVVVAIVGNEALIPTIEAIKAKKRICLANKEVLVTSGALIMPLVEENQVELIPVDSEHSALFQALQGNRLSEIEKVILTASGGPFRGKERSSLLNVSAVQALKHPKWEMGKKISIDSATLMNKGLEVIEAKWLFDLHPSQIDVVVHPESIIHSLIQYRDKSTMAQMGLPDMRLPIIYALNYPERIETKLEALDLSKIKSLSFEEPDVSTFPCLGLAYEALKLGGLVPTALNAANEVLVEKYLEDQIKFYDIPEGILYAMQLVDLKSSVTLENVLDVDQAIRSAMKVWR